VSQFLKSLTLKGYRSFEAERIEFDNPTFFVGLNGSGKSNIADALLFLTETRSSPLVNAFAKRGGPAEVAHKQGLSLATISESTNEIFPGVSVDPDSEGFDLGLAAEFGSLDSQVDHARYGFEVKSGHADKNEWYTFSLSNTVVSREQCILWGHDAQVNWFDRFEGQPFSTNASGLAPNLEPTSLGLPVLGGDSRFSPMARALGEFQFVDINPIFVGLPQPQSSDRYLNLLGANSASILSAIKREAPDDLQRISEILQSIVPEIIEVDSRSVNHLVGIDFLERSINGKRRLRGASMSDGTLRALGMILAVFQTSRPSLLLIEEPETGIHPGALGAIMDLIHHASTIMQVVVTTHSPDLLDAKWIEDRHLRVVTRENGASRVRPISEGSRRILQKHLMGVGEMFRSNALQADMDFGQGDRNLDLFVPIP
jgi:predicted ATPase